MYPTHTETRAHLATRFARTTRVLRADVPLSEEQMRAAAPSVYAEGKHASRSERYTYIPTIDVLRGLRKEGFEPFMVAQGASRVESQGRVHQAHDPNAACGAGHSAWLVAGDVGGPGPVLSSRRRLPPMNRQS